MRAVLVGCAGKMGQEILAAAKVGEIVAGVDVVGCLKIKTYGKIVDVEEKFDVIIDFSTCEDRGEIIDFAIKNNIFYCCFSTFLSEKDTKTLLEMQKQKRAVLCSNASLGIAAVINMIDDCGNLLGADVVVEEVHHKNKKDAPSGTAKEIVSRLYDNGFDSQVVSIRAGAEFGTHVIKFFLEDEVVEIVHRALSRKVFAQGALEIARGMADQKTSNC